MQEALKEARWAMREEEVPVGAVVVFENRVIGRGHNQVETLQDPTAHAEMIAIPAATIALEKKWLNGASLYVTIEPCSMCAGAMVLARLKQVVYGVPDLKTGAHSSLFNLLSDPRLNHRIEVIPGIMQKECRRVMGEFFVKRRSSN